MNLSAIGTSTYNLAKFLVTCLSPITVNKFTIKDSFCFAETIRDQNHNLFMASLDVDSLFTNIPLDETIEICVSVLYNDTDVVNGISKDDFRNLLSLATKESLFLFDGDYYQQIDGVAMGSPLGPTLANAFLCYYEKKWLNECPANFRPKYYQRYVDDVFVLFSSLKHVELFRDFMISRHPNINFTFEKEQDNKFPFLDVKITREESRFVTSVYRKPTFSGVYTNFASFIPMPYKFGLIFTLLFRCFTLVSDFSKFYVEINYLKTMLSKNGYPLHLVDSCIKLFLNRQHSIKHVANRYDVPKKEVLLVLPFLGSVSLKARTRLTKLFRKSLHCCNLKIIFKSSCRLSSLFSFKYKLPKHLLSGVVYKFTCSSCNATYIGKSLRHLKV